MLRFESVEGQPLGQPILLSVDATNLLELFSGPSDLYFTAPTTCARLSAWALLFVR